MTAGTTCKFVVLINLCSIISRVVAAGTGTNESDSCVELYEKGVEAYLENRFDKCVEYLEKSLENYHIYRKKLQNCRLKCKYEAEIAEPLYPINVENLQFYEKSLRTTLCIMRCKHNSGHYFSSFNLSPESQNIFEEKKPYEYIHLCYYKIGKNQKAASAAYTYLVSHPDDKIMTSNLKHYSQMQEVDMKSLINMEAKDFVYLYVHGAEAYENKDWDAVIQNMEESLAQYLQADDECRAYCEGPFDPGWFPDFIPSLSNHFTYCLKCKQKCKKQLSSLNGEYHEDLLPSHYHYLQYAYFRKGDLMATCQAVASYLLFMPEDETMLANLRYYSDLPKAKDSYFSPREEAMRYVQRETYESRIINFIKTEFKLNATLKLSQEDFKPKVIKFLNDKEVQGPNRFVLDGVATSQECRNLIYIAKMFATLGDGYDGVQSPHTLKEKFEGITLGRAAFLVYIGLLNSNYLKMYLDITENIRTELKRYFQITQSLYFSYTQLVCRSALPDAPYNRTDFSHEIHSDNCNILKNGECDKNPPAYTWRDYSAILYLNNDFKGGEFVFSVDPAGENIQGTVEPICGRVVAFSSGAENLHGVKAVKAGTRCALAIWFTYDPKYEEIDRPLARHMLDKNINFSQFTKIDISEMVENTKRDEMPS